MGVKDLSYVMDICGSTCATIVIFIIPAQFLRVAVENEAKAGREVSTITLSIQSLY